MVSPRSILLLVGLGVGLVPRAAGYKSHGPSKSATSFDDYCMLAINNVLGTYTFKDPSASTATSSGSSSTSTGYASGGHAGHGGKSRRGYHHGSTGTTYCTSEMEVTSYYATAKAYCSEKDFAQGLVYWKSLCASAGASLIDMATIEAKVTDSYIAALPVLDPSTTSTTTAITNAVILDKAYYRIAYHSAYSKDYALQLGDYYSWGLMGFWGLVLVVAMLEKLVSSVKSMMAERSLSRRDVEGGAASAPAARPGPFGKAWHVVRTWAVIPAGLAPCSDRHQIQYFWHTVPRRLDSIVVYSFWIISIVFCCVSYDTFTGDIDYTSLPMQNWQYVTDRTGVLALGLLPFLWLFAGRNNIFLWCTNVSFRSFNIYHRHIAWVATLMAITHSIGYTVIECKAGYYIVGYKTNYFYMGVVAVISMSFLVIFSHAWIRFKRYELFLITHVCLSILALYALYRHVNFQNTTWQKRVYPLMAIWGLDRFLRIVRLVYCNLRVRWGKNIVRNKSAVRYFADAGFLRIEITPGAPFASRPGPGQYYYLYQPVSWRGWENHPFSLGAYTTKKAGGTAIVDNSNSSTDSGSTQAGEYENSLVFYVRPYNGWTNRLKKQCIKAAEQGSVVHPRLLIEGPYGAKSELQHFDTVLLFVGGTGISAAVPYVLEHAQRAAEGRTRTTRFHVIWSNRQQVMFDRIAGSDLREALLRDDVHADFYLTGSSLPAALSSSKSVASKTSSQKETMASTVGTLSGQDSSGSDNEKDPAVTCTARYRIIQGRPDIKGIIAATVDQSEASQGSVAVLVSGPGQMADNARAGVFAAMRGGFHRIEYFEETMGW